MLRAWIYVNFFNRNRRVAQLVERYHDMVDVSSSNLLVPTRLAGGYCLQVNYGEAMQWRAGTACGLIVAKLHEIYF